jgi:hypothetical protein
MGVWAISVVFGAFKVIASVPILVTPNHTKPLLNVNRMNIIRLTKQNCFKKRKKKTVFCFITDLDL